ncbi:MAG: outer membrane beta-barrel protein [Deltaproteobacteria bacterium]|jgi:hypothetical protein|nr:outer membrane beta-barrel protein [Deltaproteobacteria bacterium]MBT6434703.1 outer membrane beta-barrel protein [Deltaproteobacteria bacterium]
MKKVGFIGIALMLCVPSLAGAEEAASTGVTVSGFIDASLSTSFTGTDIDKKITYGVDQVELDFSSSPAAGLTVRTDLNVFPAGGAIDADNLIEQAYLEYYFGGGSDGFSLTVGKVNAPVGIEALDPVDMYQYSSGLLFEHATPSNLTGVFAGYTSGAISAKLWMANDWDKAGSPDLPNFGGRFEYGLEELGHVALSTTFEQGSDQLMVDVDSALKFGDVTVFIEANMGMLDSEIAIGALGKVNYAFSDSYSATARFDYLDQSKTGGHKGMSGTGAFLFAVNDNFIGAVEVRADKPDGEDVGVTGAVELIASF